MAKRIFYVHHCDEWKDYDSMRLVFIGTSQQKLKMFVSKLIEDERMEYGDTDRSPKEQAKVFRHDWDFFYTTAFSAYVDSIRRINDALVYGYIDYCYDNDPETL